jgi:6-phosphofructokinase 1
MTKSKKRKGTIAILTGGGDVPGLNPAIRAVTVRALREGYRVLGLRRGWAGLIELDRNQEPGDDIVTVCGPSTTASKVRRSSS